MGYKGLLEAQMSAACTPSFSGRRRLESCKRSSSLIGSNRRRQTLKVVMTTSLPRWATSTSPVTPQVFVSSSVSYLWVSSYGVLCLPLVKEFKEFSKTLLNYKELFTRNIKVRNPLVGCILRWRLSTVYVHVALDIHC